MGKAQRVTAFTMSLEDRPGALLEVMRKFREKKVNLAGIWGYSMGPGQAELMVVGKDPDKVRAALTSFGRQFTERSGFFLKGADKVGALTESLQALTESGINLDAANAVAVGGKYGAYFWVKEEFAAKVEEIMRK